MRKAVSYARYSSDNQREESIDAQLSDNKKYASTNKMIIIKEYIDRGISGTTDNREEFQRMISDAKYNEFTAIIVHKVDRFARNRYDSAVYKSVLEKHGVRVHYAMQNIEDSPEGALMEGILESFAEYYSLNLAVEVMKGMKENAKQAKFNGGTPPLGFDVDDKQNYIINEKESYIVKELFDLYLKGFGYKEIAKRLNQKGYRNKRGKEFVFNSIPGILKNEKYAGTYTYNKTRRSFKDGKRNLKEYKAPSEVVRIERALPIVIPMEVFNMAQDELKRRSKSRGKSKTVREYFLSGVIVCSDCNRKMTGHSQRRVAGGDRYFYYRCTKCNNSIRCESIEKKVLEELNKIIFSDLDTLLEKMHAYVLKQEDKAPAEIKYLQSELSKTNKEITNIVDLVTKGITSLELGKKLEELELYKNGVENRLKEINIKSNISEDKLKDWLENMKVDLDKEMSLKKIIPLFVREIRLNKEGYEIDFFIKALQDSANCNGVSPAAPHLFAQTVECLRKKD